MHWAEKIDVIKKNFSDDDFSIPMVNRKAILRKIESRFISRSKDYYFSNSFNGVFNDWWSNFKTESSSTILLDKKAWDKLDHLIPKKEVFWFAAEFDGYIEIYRARKPAILSLMNIGRTWSKTYHIIGLKYQSMLSLKFEVNHVIIKSLGKN